MKVSSPVKQAEALAKRMNRYNKTQEAMAEILGQSRSFVTALLSLLRLEPEAQALVHNGALSKTHGKYLACAPAHKQCEYAQLAAKNKLSVKQLWAVIYGDSLAKKIPEVQMLEHNLSDYFGAHVTLNTKGTKGQLRISFNSLDELDGILERIGYRDAN